MKADASGEDILGIVIKAKSGDKEAFARLYDQLFVKIFQFIFYRVGHKETAEDLSEEVFVKVYQKLSSLEKLESFESWVYQIARNLVIDYYRSKKQLVPLENVENTLEYETNIIDVVNLKTNQILLIKLLKELSEEQQLIIKLKFLEGFSNEEVAKITDKNEGAIRVIQHRALNKLKQLLAQIIQDNEQE